jgi:hypothetical protein
MCSSPSILTQAFQRGKTGNVERGSLMQFPRDSGEFANFGDDF